MKKLLSLIVSVLCAVSMVAFAGCGNSTPSIGDNGN